MAALAGDALVIPELARRFGVAEVLTATKGESSVASLMHFFGILTLGGLTSFNESILRIPNLAARRLYVERLRRNWRPTAAMPTWP